MAANAIAPKRASNPIADQGIGSYNTPGIPNVGAATLCGDMNVGRALAPDSRDAWAC